MEDAKDASDAVRDVRAVLFSKSMSAFAIALNDILYRIDALDDMKTLTNMNQQLHTVD